MMVSAEKAAGAVILSAHDVIAENKTDARNVVTAYDGRVQEMLTSAFSSLLPGAHFFCEENDVHDSLNVEHAFIIDPIDGTANFVHGFSRSCISAAYASYGEVVAAAVYDPYYDRMFTAEKNRGAYLNGRAIHVSDESIGESIAAVGTSPYYPDLYDSTFRMMRGLFDRALDIRRSGSAEIDLCEVAAGYYGIFVELRLSYWDYAAGALIVEEAGGKVLQCSGKQLPADGSKSSILAGTDRAVREFLESFPEYA